ncbi:hypothetical protein BHE74_00051871 [Ensete ventricosum]|nr:hypothetical protein BHE74_00051871 [Ensete ventricosum]
MVNEPTMLLPAPLTLLKRGICPSTTLTSNLVQSSIYKAIQTETLLFIKLLVLSMSMRMVIGCSFINPPTFIVCGSA